MNLCEVARRVATRAQGVLRGGAGGRIFGVLRVAETKPVGSEILILVTSSVTRTASLIRLSRIMSNWASRQNDVWLRDGRSLGARSSRSWRRTRTRHSA